MPVDFDSGFKSVGFGLMGRFTCDLLRKVSGGLLEPPPSPETPTKASTSGSGALGMGMPRASHRNLMGLEGSRAQRDRF